MRKPKHFYVYITAIVSDRTSCTPEPRVILFAASFSTRTNWCQDSRVDITSPDLRITNRSSTRMRRLARERNQSMGEEQEDSLDRVHQSALA